MKYIPTFASVIALIWAAAMTLRAERLPWIVPAYVLAQLVFALIAFLGLQRDVLMTRGYTWLFIIGFAVVLLFALGFAEHQGLAAPGLLGWSVLPWTLAHFAFLAWVLHRILTHYNSAVPGQIKMALFQGTILLACGVVALLSTALRLPPELNIAAVAFGGFWICMGAFMWAWSVGFTRNLQAWLTLNNFLPAMLAVVAFAFMAHELGKLQAEGSHAVAHEVSFDSGMEVQR